MAATVWKGYITFGMVSIPVAGCTWPPVPSNVAFHEVHEKCNSRIKQQLYCPTCERTVMRDELVKGYEIQKGEFVTVTDDELKKIAPELDRHHGNLGIEQHRPVRGVGWQDLPVR